MSVDFKGMFKLLVLLFADRSRDLQKIQEPASEHNGRDKHDMIYLIAWWQFLRLVL